jgi:DNA-binding IscR family transcriptional regulator
MAGEPLRDVWIAVRANIRSVLEHVTLADIAARKLPTAVKKIAETPGNRE